MVLKGFADFLELLECRGELLGHLGDGHRRADTGHNVFALGVGQELTHELLLAGSGVARESNTRAAVIAHVAEGHHLHVNSSAPGIGDVVIAAVNIGAGVVPAAEHGLDGAHELLFRVVREVLANLGFVFRLELACELLEVIRGEVNVLRDAALFLHFVDELLKVLLADFHNHVRVHLDETAIAVPRPAGVVGLLGDNIHNRFVQAEVEDGVHHARHGSAGTGTDGNQQRVLEVAELLAGDLFQLADVFIDLIHDLVVDLLAVFIVLGAGFGRDREALRNRHAKAGHFSKVRALAAKEIPHGGVTFAEKVDILVCHRVNLPPYNINQN